MILDHRFYYPAQFYERSAEVLNTALDATLLYQSWRAFDPGRNADINQRYAALPTLTKDAIRAHFPDGLIPYGKDREAALEQELIEYTFTSGTTSERVINIWNQAWWNRCEAASWQLNKYTAALPYPVKMAELASSLNVGISCEEDLPLSHRIIGNKLYLNEKSNLIQWQKRHYQRMADELALYQPVVLEANPSLLARLAYWALDHHVALYSPKVIIFTYEFSSKIHLRVIREVFDSALVSSFGSTETGFVMEECSAGLLHQNTDFCRIDFTPLKDIYGGPDLGRIRVTTFDNDWNVIVCFDTGDLIRLHHSGQCACGNHQGMIAEAVEGRITNVTFTTANRLVTTYAVDQQLACIPEIRDYHLEQHQPSQYELQVMLTETSQAVLDRIQKTLQDLYGADGEYVIKAVSNILPGPAGKFRRTQANFTFDEKELFV
ncbi:MAG: hypothetical protein VB012_04900 [Erysipelotrichaceae bacterium]|nr:hypothetical protein [Erysipelotrichaceae bacterium]